MELKSRLYFSAYNVEVAYDKVASTLYVRRDIILSYYPVNNIMGLQIVGGDNKSLEIIEKALVPKQVYKLPKGLIWTSMPQKSVEMYSVNSSNVVSVGYDETTQELYIEYKGGVIYQYKNVPEEYWNALQNADSKGSWIHWFLKINDKEFPYTKVNGANLVPATSSLSNTGTPHPEGYMTGFQS